RSQVGETELSRTTGNHAATVSVATDTRAAPTPGRTQPVRKFLLQRWCRLVVGGRGYGSDSRPDVVQA
ncbi:hypothetical protein, partial [Mycobacterium sp. E342]|uniref:hypothetical protein n=1 Tax=Mycobacterium sp. E342 TaxID=1834147 RepID=UPI001E47BF8B